MSARIAIVGAGLAGLAAAYKLRNRADITLFEAESCIGGRVLTSKRPRGEQGAEFFVGSEGTIRSLLCELGIGQQEVCEEGAYLIRRGDRRPSARPGSGGGSKVAQGLTLR